MLLYLSNCLTISKHCLGKTCYYLISNTNEIRVWKVAQCKLLSIIAKFLFARSECYRLMAQCNLLGFQNFSTNFRNKLCCLVIRIHCKCKRICMFGLSRRFCGVPSGNISSESKMSRNEKSSAASNI